MNGETAWALYENRLRRVSAYIHDHLDEELDMERLAEIACMSSYHWHRIYRAIYGETLAATVKRLRLHHAAGEIVRTELAVSEIAKRSGYPNLQSFNRIFKSVYGMPPARYRKEGSHTAFEPSPNGKTKVMLDVTIREIGPIELIGVPHTGSYMHIDKAFETLFGTLYARGLAKPEMRMIGIYLDDPDIVAEEKLRSIACVTGAADVTADAPFERRTIDGGDYAVLRHEGPYANMPKSYQWLFAEWLPKSGRQLKDRVMFEEYLNNPREVSPTELLTDIHMPLV
ncbi:AraC family transcriptional regulator [Rhizobium ruizarguesonis]|uniref:AraC family transcriptional regulator n=1 Tax=Rhizobium ruizarguesonis TaxID=2081791 RepID=A0ABY1XAF1_9HYPH|nr:AraC family transcriptional regulator [Rhizobium ruizarguesonis]NKJ74643.1 helix-turn-helix domain-containing protein [Rhizobium leguminosarum bv. viciae]MBC2804048.1 AraC family transcriptional regulator [Rhizobium ruizarguesonis]NKQ73382.1 GyrI-like domain-containing protein [Rhizobium ruizarguesonis]NKQ80247.1 GyrI-like domain-containing protein [Rhizobium ruizarguesonis]TAU26928.1 AraC family transcriptional regulator [Rhizobium ruizarguesonis]